MSNRVSNQLDFFSLNFKESFPTHLKPYAYDILKKLYYKNGGLNVKEAFNLFHNDKSKKVRETLNLLSSENYNLIIINEGKSNGTEKRYFITKFGKNVLTEHYKNK